MSLSRIFVNNTQVTSIDDEPIFESENLIESGGVAKYYAQNGTGCIHTNSYITTKNVEVGQFYRPGVRSFNGLNYYDIKLYKNDYLIIDYKGNYILGDVPNIIICNTDSVIIDIIPLSTTITTYTASTECIAYFNIPNNATVRVNSNLISERSYFSKIDYYLRRIDITGYKNQQILIKAHDNIGLPIIPGKKFMAYVSSTSNNNVEFVINYSNGEIYKYLLWITSVDFVYDGTMPNDAKQSYFINLTDEDFNGVITFVYEEDSYTNLVSLPKIIGVENFEDITINQYEGGYITPYGGVKTTTDIHWLYTDYIEVTSNSNYIYIGSLPYYSASEVGLAIYDENYNCVRAITASSGSFTSKEIFINIDEKYLRLSSNTTSIQLKKEVITGGQDYKYNEFDNRISYLENNYKLINDNNSFCGIYKFGVLGDSLSVGHMDNQDSQLTTSRNILMSWPQILARKNGQIALNFGRSGVTAGSWWTDSKCKNELIKPENYCQSYIIGLGVNDQSTTIGTLEDVDWNDYNNNQNTFIGNFTKILQLIHDIKPDAIIFVLTPAYPYNYGVFETISNAIKDICNDSNIISWNTVFLIDLNKYDSYMRRYAQRYMQGYHFSSCGYAFIADFIQFAISQVIDNNINSNVNLRQIGFIEYGSNLTPIE